MSHIFDTLRGLEDERGGSDSRVPSEVVDLLGLAKGRVAPQSEASLNTPTSESLRPIGSAEARLRIMGLPLMVGGRSLTSLHSPVSAPPVPSIPLPPVPAAVSTAPVSPAEEPRFKVRQEVAASIQPERSLPSRAEQQFKVHQEVAASIQPERSSPS